MKIVLTFLLSLFLSSSFAEPRQIYDPNANSSEAINKALLRAKAEKKFIFIQVGGNWCPWCIKFHDNYLTDPEISAIMSSNYIPVLVNYSKENKNLPLLEKLEFPQRFGFPVFVILNTNGKRIHTQNSAYLEEGDGYSKKKIIDFLKQWSPEAFKPEHYK